MSRIKKRQFVDFTEGPMLKKMILFALPIIANHLLQSLYNSTDMIVVGQFAENGAFAMGAVGACGPLIRVFINFFFGIAAGVGICVAQKIGAKEEDAVQKYIHTAAVMSFVSGVVLMVVGWFMAERMLIWTGVPDTMLPDATAYMKAYFVGMPAMMVLNFLSASLRAAGDTYHTMIFMAIAGAANVLANLVAVVGFGMGAVGVGIGTTVAQTLGAVMIVVYMMRLEGICNFSFKKLAVFGEMVKGILANGIPVGIQSTVLALSNVIVQAAKNSYGDIVIAGATAAGTIEGYIGVVLSGFATAVITMVSQNVGAKRYDRVKEILKMALVLVVVLGIVLGALVTVFGDALLRLFVSDDEAAADEIRSEGMKLMYIVCLPYFIIGIYECFTAALKGMKKAISAMVLSIVGMCGIKLLWIYFVLPHLPWDASMLYVAYPIAWALTALAAFAVFVVVYRGKIKELSVLKVENTASM